MCAPFGRDVVAGGSLWSARVRATHGAGSGSTGLGVSCGHVRPPLRTCVGRALGGRCTRPTWSVLAHDRGLGLEQHAESGVDVLLDLLGEIEDIPSGGTSVVDQHQRL